MQALHRARVAAWPSFKVTFGAPRTDNVRTLRLPGAVEGLIIEQTYAILVKQKHLVACIV